MSTERLSEADMLSALPCKPLFKILSYLCPIGDGLALISTSNTLHEKLIVQLYKEAGRQLNWLPLLFGVTEWRETVLETCLKAGAPLDHRWPCIDQCPEKSDSESSFKFCDALDWADWSGQDKAREWLTKKKANDTQKQLPRVQPGSSIKMLDARWLVFGVRTSKPEEMTCKPEKTWRPVLYQREVHQPDAYSYEPYRRSAHLVWYGPKIEPCLVFPRLRDILKAHCDFRTSRGDLWEVDSDFALWISRFWLDMLLSSSNRGPIFESGFFKSTRSRDGKYHGEMGNDVVFGKASLISNMMYYLQNPEFGRHFSPSIFRLLLDSRADVSLIASAYVSILDNLFSYRRQKVEYIPTFRFYPLILRELIDSGADINKIEDFRFKSSVSLLSYAGSDELPGVLSEALDDMANCGASPDEMIFAFSLFAESLLQCSRQQSLSSFPLVEDLATRLGV
ncbi:hypothetical protein CEP52_011565 [Fusarium oligoseptatum]|uniref:F-box domain-containing protein n=1 Tax=Fusarium oligoseptatum TaxID=2604345 RepID=A0A428T2I6_9HYPO|nr:hypothetical protein CEP52_011565 [Fusarium oligoseptatum]